MCPPCWGKLPAWCCWLCAGGDLPPACPHRQVRDLYLVGMVEVDHKRKSDNRLSTGRRSQFCPGPLGTRTPCSSWQPMPEQLLP